MSGKQLIWGGMVIGSTIGGFVPYLWTSDLFSTVIGSTVGGLAGIWAGLKFAKYVGVL